MHLINHKFRLQTLHGEYELDIDYFKRENRQINFFILLNVIKNKIPSEIRGEVKINIDSGTNL